MAGDGWVYVKWAKRPRTHQRSDARTTDVREVKSWVWCDQMVGCHVAWLRCGGSHFQMLRTTQAHGLRRGKHSPRGGPDWSTLA